DSPPRRNSSNVPRPPKRSLGGAPAVTPLILTKNLQLSLRTRARQTCRAVSHLSYTSERSKSAESYKEERHARFSVWIGTRSWIGDLIRSQERRRDPRQHLTASG